MPIDDCNAKKEAPGCRFGYRLPGVSYKMIVFLFRQRFFCKRLFMTVPFKSVLLYLTQL